MYEYRGMVDGFYSWLQITHILMSLEDKMEFSGRYIWAFPPLKQEWKTLLKYEYQRIKIYDVSCKIFFRMKPHLPR
jgi:hypothetical protein